MDFCKKLFLILLVVLSFSQANASPITAQNLFKEIKTKNITTVEDTLSILPNQCFESYGLMYHSRSIQDASFEYPRAILSCTGVESSSGEPFFTLSFSGDNKTGNYNRLEILQSKVNDPFQYEMAEIVFSKNKTTPTLTINPSRCTECHGINSKPIFDRYPRWPGLYNSSLRATVVGSKEYDGYQAFKGIQSSHSRYSFLTLYDEVYYQNGDLLKLNTNLSGASNPFGHSYTNHFINSEPFRLTRLVMQNRHFNKMKYLWAAIPAHCQNDLSSFFPSSVQNDVVSAYSSIETETYWKVYQSETRLIDEILKNNPATKTPFDPITDDRAYYASRSSKVAFGILLLRLAEMNEREFFTTPSVREIMLPQGEDGFKIFPRDMLSEPIRYPSFQTTETDVLSKLFKKYKFSSFSYPPTKNQKLCDDLAGESKNVFSSMSKADLSAWISRLKKPSLRKLPSVYTTNSSFPSKVLARCDTCHNAGINHQTGAPSIPFLDQINLEKNWLADKKFIKRICFRIRSQDVNQMPPNVPLSNSEYEHLVNYLECK